jgi:hypothetical protein
MKTNLLFLLPLSAFLWQGCLSSKAPYLPKAKDIPLSAFGSYATFSMKNQKKTLSGELISVQSEMIYLINNQGMADSVKIHDIKKFKIYFAKPPKYGYTIPTSVAASAFHGRFLLFSAPINAFITTIVTAGSYKSYSYNQHDIELDNIRYFARFPQGLPEHVTIHDVLPHQIK